MKAIFKSSRDIVLLILFMFLVPLVSHATDTIRVNIPRERVTQAGNYSFASSANSVYVPVEFTFAMNADRVADYMEESNALLYDHYGDGVVEMSGVSDDFGTVYIEIKANPGMGRVIQLTSVSSNSKVITVVQAGDTPESEPEPEPEPDEKFDIPGNWKMVRRYTDGTGDNYITDITFYDGLGYPEQTVNVGASPSGGRNIVTPIVYDRMRRGDSVLFLPYAASTANTIREESSPLAAQSAFYAGLYGQGEGGHARTRRVYEPSPLDRVSREYRPGSAYSDRHVSHSHGTNAAGEVFNLRVDPGTGALTVDSSSPYYAAGRLFKETVTDEDGKTLATYTDVAGRVVMETRGTDSRTYYVHDDRGFLSWVVTPNGSALLSPSTNWSRTSAEAAAHCYVYSRDYRGNITEKGIPGAGTGEYVYDRGGRLVLERDASLKAGGRWIYHVYDNMGRETERNLIQGASSVTRAAAQAGYDNLTAYNSYPELGGGTTDTPPAAVGRFTLVGKLVQIRYGGGMYRTASSAQMTAFTVPSYLAFSPVEGVAESADLDNVRVTGYRLYERIALLGEGGGTDGGIEGYIERAYHYDRRGRVMQVLRGTWREAQAGRARSMTSGGTYWRLARATRRAALP